MKYYCATCHGNGETWREIVEYDESNGIREYPEYTIINHGSLIVNKLYDTVNDALCDWGDYSEKCVRLPNGKVVRPCDVFHPEYAIRAVFIPWADVRGEIWS